MTIIERVSKTVVHFVKFSKIIRERGQLLELAAVNYLAKTETISRMKTKTCPKKGNLFDVK